MPHRIVRATDIAASDVDRRHFIRNYLLANAYEFALAAAAILSCVTYFVAPETLSQGSVAVQVDGGLAVVWSVMYGLAGVFILWGMFTASLRRELAGLSLLTGAIAINTASILAVRGPQGATAALTYIGLMLASAARARLIVKIVARRDAEDDGGERL